MNRTKHKLLSSVLAVVLLLQTAIPTMAFAAETTPKTIIGISALTETKFDVPSGADETAVKELLESFPKTITVEVEYLVTEETQPVAESNPEQLPKQSADLPSAEITPNPEETSEPSAENTSLPPAPTEESSDDTQTPEITTNSDAPAEDDERMPTFGVSSAEENGKVENTLVEKVVSEQVELAVTWESDKELSTEEAGEFIYTAVLSDDDKVTYNFAAGVSLPKITVTVSTPERTNQLDLTSSSFKSEQGVVENPNGVYSKESEGWSFNENTNTLTLNGLILITDDSIALKASGDFKIVLEDSITNSITSNYQITKPNTISAGIQAEKLTIRGNSGILNIRGGSAYISYGVLCDSIHMEGGTLKAEGGDVGSDNKDSIGLLYMQNSAVHGGSLTAVGGNCGDDASTIGLSGDSTDNPGLSIIGGTVNAYTKNANEWCGFNIALSVPGIFRTEGGTIDAKAGNALYCSLGITAGSAVVSGGTVTAKSGTKIWDFGTFAAMEAETIEIGNNMGIFTDSDFQTPAYLGINESQDRVIIATEAGGSVAASPVKITVNPTVTVGGTYTYTGTAITPAASDITVKHENTTLTEGTDYTFTATNNVSAGTATLTVVFKGNYSGIVKSTFTIGKANITIKANDKSANVGDTAPAISATDYTISGLASGEMLKTEPAIAYQSAPDMSKAGTVAIGASGAEAPDGGNYNTIIYQNGTLTITAKNTSGGGDSGGNSDGNSGDIITMPPATESNPNPSTPLEIVIYSKTNKNGKAIAAASNKSVTDAIKRAQEKAKNNGTEKTDIAITLNVEADKNATSLETTLFAASIEALIKAGVTETTIKNGLSSLTFDLTALRALSGGEVKLSISKVDPKTLSEEAYKVIGNRPVFRFGANVGGKAVTNFKGGRVGLQMPYTLTGNETAGNLVGVFVSSNSKVTWLENSSYDPFTSTFLTSTNHFSVYGVGYKQSTPKFSDTSSHWAKNDIDFVVARKLVSGKSSTTFAPDTGMTRGMFVTALGRLAGVDTKKYTSTKFTDVKADAYYAPYVAWASVNSIVNGTTDTAFAPDNAITRQEIAVMLVNYSKTIGYKLPSVHAEVSFSDNSSIGTWAKDAVKQMQMAGILMGKSGNKFAPTAAATRAEVSAILRRYVELIVSTETAESWAMNESGQWMYIQDGKRVTGMKTIDGKSYTFDQYGVTTALPPERRYLTYTVQAGDSFWGIAWKYNISVFELAAANDKTIFSTIHAGEELKVPQNK